MKKPAQPMSNKKINQSRLAGLSIEYWWLAAITALGAVLRWAYIAKSSIWYDEGFSMMLSARTPSEIWVTNIRDVHPPLYYLVLHYWLLLFGTSETAARSLSAVLMLGVIISTYFLVKRFFSVPTARLAALFVACGPYMVRFSQEARMYGMLTFFLITATYFLVRAVQDNRKIDYVVYGLLMTAAIYTHYYTIFAALVHWLYILHSRPLPAEKRKNPLNWILADKAWFASMIGLVVLFLPWLPKAVGQFTKVSNGFWIAGPAPDTIARTLIQFLTFDNLDIPAHEAFKISTLSFNPISVAWHLLALVGFIGLIVLAYRSNKAKRNGLMLFTTYALLPSLLVFLISLRRAIYLDRYFTFAAVAFYALLAILIYLDWGKKPLPAVVRWTMVAVILATMGWGITNVYAGENHHMRDTANDILAGYQPGDSVVSAELYTFFDMSYYMNQYHLGQLRLLRSGETIDGYGVTSLIYDRLDGIILEDYADLKPSSGYVWVIAQETREDFFTKVPANWQTIGPRGHEGRVETQRFFVAK
jgi:mannosyltransferase